MSIASMTGFSRAEGRSDVASWAWELRSVNNRAFDLRVRVPQGYDAVESAVRTSLAAVCKRGSFTATLTVSEEGRRPVLRVNEAVLASVLSAMRDLEGRVDAAPPRLDGLLTVRGVLESVEPDADPQLQEQLHAGIRDSLDAALAGLVAMRAEEGARLVAMLTAQLDAVAGLVGEARAAAATQPEAITRRLQQQLAELLDPSRGLTAERLAQEAALLALKADVREELDRLKSHLEAARALLAEGGAVGRRLDFLMQEFNREANTLCSKSSALELTTIGLALKAAIEQMREQVQNIE